MTRGRAALLYVVITLLFAWPVLTTIEHSVPHDAGDPVLNAWILWWNTQAIPYTDAWWNAPMFAPSAGVFAFSEVLLALVPLTAPVQWLTGNPITAYNVAWILAFPLCALSVYALCREIVPASRLVAWVAGLAFTFAPFRMAQLSHLQGLAYYGAPIVLLGLHRFVATGQRRWLALFGGAWLVQALSNGYALFHVSVFVALWMVWFVRSRRAVVMIATAWIVAALPVVPLLLEYQHVHDALHLGRDINEIKGFGVDLSDFLSPSPDLFVWGGRLGTPRPETTVFPGATLLVIGAIGLWQVWRTRRTSLSQSPDVRVWVWISLMAGGVALSALVLGPWHVGPLRVTAYHKPFSIAVAARVIAWLRGPWIRERWQRRSPAAFYVLAMITMYVLALGPEPRLLGRPILYEPPYAWLMHLPGFATLRVPARFAMLGVLSQVVLMAFVLARAVGSARRATVIPVLVAAGILLDGWVRVPTAVVDRDFVEVDEAVDAVLEVPPGDQITDFAAIGHAMLGGHATVNGYSGYFPPHYLPLMFAVRDGQVDVVRDLTPGRPLLVAVDRRRADADRLVSAFTQLSGATAWPSTERWHRVRVMGASRGTPAKGPVIRVAAIDASLWPEDIARALDGDVGTAWHGGTAQVGGEAVTIDLGSSQLVSALQMSMGSYAFGFPRELRIETETDAGERREVWRGATATLAVRGAVSDPSDAPLDVVFAPTEARRLHLTQLGAEPGIPWWIPEITVYGPSPTGDPASYR